MSITSPATAYTVRVLSANATAEVMQFFLILSVKFNWGGGIEHHKSIIYREIEEFNFVKLGNDNQAISQSK